MNEQILMKNNAQKLLPTINSVEQQPDSVLLTITIAIENVQK